MTRRGVRDAGLVRTDGFAAIESYGSSVTASRLPWSPGMARSTGGRLRRSTRRRFSRRCSTRRTAAASPWSRPYATAQSGATWPLLYRFSGAAEIEGTFVACSFWLVDALVRSGQSQQAGKLWHELTAHVSDLGLLAEEIDPATGAFPGNLPQGLSHLALLNAAALLNKHQD
jgi:hypothetical protein